MDQTIRNKLRSVVTQCRKLLEDATSQALQGRFGIHFSSKKGEIHVEDERRMVHLSEEDRSCRQDLLDHLEHIKAIGYRPSEALQQLIREISFTHLNRLCAYKMMETRGLIREAVSRGTKSQGFFFYIADHPEDEKLHNSGQQEAAYRHYLDWLGGTLSHEIGVLFNPSDPANRIYPAQRVLEQVLGLINAQDLDGIWTEDETIGWVYQYFTPKEMRDKARKESQAPRNSYELAFRNQFFTPRYVVEFLTDNTLGRVWYEMRKSQTSLRDRCRYLVRRSNEIFLAEGEASPAATKEVRDDLSQEELLKQPVYVSHRAKKDPREIKILDPACGSGHFLVYCFDLLQIIYEEAYDDPDLGIGLRREYPALNDLRKEIPALILRHNLHGIDIDLRATQIAALALWLRCQRAYQQLGLQNGERPPITRSNIVCAEPMPGEPHLLREFRDTLQPKVLGQLVEVIFDKMKLAGEVGSLLKIEEEIQEVSQRAKVEYVSWKNHLNEAAGTLFPALANRTEPGFFDFADLTDEAFFERVEDEIVVAVRQYAEKTSNGKTFLRRLFAEDAARGFAFIDICHKKFDVVLMNPPFGEASLSARNYIAGQYPASKNDILGPFIECALSRTGYNTLVGAITSKTAFFLSSMERWRTDVVFYESTIEAFADLGEGILDTAMVKTAAYILRKTQEDFNAIEFFDVSKNENKGHKLLQFIRTRLDKGAEGVYFGRKKNFEILPGCPLPYWASEKLRMCFEMYESLEQHGIEIKQGLGTTDDFRFVRTFWEVDLANIGDGRRWQPYAKGGESQAFYGDIHLLVNWEDGGREIYEKTGIPYGGAGAPVRNPSYYFRPGLTYTSYTNKGCFSPRVLPPGCIFTTAGMAIFAERPLLLLAVLNSSVVQSLLSMITDNRKWEVGYVQKTPLAEFDEDIVTQLEDSSIRAWALTSRHDSLSETSRLFSCLAWMSDAETLDECLIKNKHDHKILSDKLIEIRESINQQVCSAYGLNKSDLISSADTSKSGFSDEEGEDDKDDSTLTLDSIISYAIGVLFGRWDIRFSTGERVGPKPLNPFAPLNVYSPGMLQWSEGLPGEPNYLPSNYPISIDIKGVLTDDPKQNNDIVHRVRDVLDLIWKDRSEAVEKEACNILGVRQLRSYFRKPGNGGFWMNHVRRYSKSRRKAPIYWYLRSAKGNYGLWLYYHRLNKDMLFKALLNHVEPKIRLEEESLRALRDSKRTAGSSGREAKRIERDLDLQEEFVSELNDFQDKLRRAADLHLEPDLNDGVVLNIAPLWELVPWKEAKNYWDELMEGKYEWSSIGKQLRQKGIVS